MRHYAKPPAVNITRRSRLLVNERYWQLRVEGGQTGCEALVTKRKQKAGTLRRKGDGVIIAKFNIC